MTLNITLVSREIIFQVSDRRFTEIGTLKPVDDNGNKAIVLGCKDGIAAITFTGLATFSVGKSLQRVDRWLAEGMQKARIPERHLEDAVAFIADATGELFGRIFSRQAIEHAYVIAGWHYGDSPDATAWVVSNRATGGKVFAVEPPFSPRGNRAGIQVTGLREAFTRSIRRRLMRSLRGLNTPDTTETALIAAIREAASNSTGIGKDCMAIALSASGDARATFYPESANPHTFGPLCLWNDGTTNMLAGDFDITPGLGYPLTIGDNSCPFNVVLGQRGHQLPVTQQDPLVVEATLRVSGKLSPGQTTTFMQVHRKSEGSRGKQP